MFRLYFIVILSFFMMIAVFADVVSKNPNKIKDRGFK